MTNKLAWIGAAGKGTLAGRSFVIGRSPLGLLGGPLQARRRAGGAAGRRGVQVERAPVLELLGKTPDLEAVRLADGPVISLQAVFMAPDIRMASPLAEEIGCALEQGPMGPYIRVDDWKQTTVAGVYAAGNAAGPMHNATPASASGVLAGVGAHQSLARETAAS